MAGAELLSGVETNADIYFIQQHYGMPTRLLDWSHNPLAALYFAVSDQVHDAVDGRLFLLDAYQFRSRAGGDRTVGKFKFQGVATSRNPAFKAALRPIYEWHENTTDFPSFIIPVRPDHLGGRVNYQQSCFTFHGPNHGTLVDADNDTIKMYKIPSISKQKIREELTILNVNEFSIYGDLVSLSKFLRDSHRI